ncbi:hypothetical protein J4E91_009317 [Alternaria rosae]|nr:hypothetical protein J4E91_009317 [Alternaria rosae]
MDPISVTVGTLGLIESLNKILRRYPDLLRSTPGGLGSDEIFGELSILLWVLAESKMLTDEVSDQPASLIIALQRCRKLSAQLEKKLFKLSRKPANTMIGTVVGTVKLSVHIASLNTSLSETFTAFKSAVILFRDIGTNALTIQLLKKASGTAIEPVNRLHLDNSKLPTNSPHKNGIEPKEQLHSQRQLPSSPAERSSLFNATISIIADGDASALPQSQRDAFGLPCECGRSRMGIWFPVRGKFDSGSNSDFVSEDVIKRAGLESFVTKAEEPATLEMFGTDFVFDEKISLSWVLNNHEKSYSGEFWVAPNANNFDFIIGEPWLIEHGYERNGARESHAKTSFFGMFNLRLPGGSKAKRKAEDATAAGKLAAAKEQSKHRREAAFALPTQAAPLPGPFAIAGNTSTSTTGPNTSASQTSIGSSSITPTSNITGPGASASIPHAVPNQTNTQNIKPGPHAAP